MSAPILKVDIQANAKQLEAALNKAKAKVQELGAKIQSLPTGDKQFNKLANEIARAENVYQRLAASYNKLGVESEKVAPKFEQVGNSSKSARTALTSLSLTVQDLPFGFLGIQNNLPGVIQGFGNLTATTNGKVLPALKEIGKSLIGPAGIFLAFSAVTSIVTVLVQKYGSLGGAIDALFGKQKTLTTEIKKFNEEYEKFIKNQPTVARVTQDATASQKGQITIVQALIKRLSALNISQEEQKNIIEELKNTNQDFFGNLTVGKNTIDDIKNATERYNKVLIAKSKIQAYKDEINAAQTLIDENKRLLASQKDVVKADKERKVSEPFGAGQQEFLSRLFKKLEIKENAKELDNLGLTNKQLQARIDALSKAIDSETIIVTQNTTQFTKAGAAVQKYFEAYKAPKAYLDFIDFYSNENLLQRGTQAFNDLNRIDLTNGAQALLDFQQILKQLQDDFPIDFTGFEQPTLKTLPAAIKKVGEILKRELDYVALDIAETDIISQLIEKIRKDLEKATEKIKKSEGKIFIDIPLDMSNVLGKGPGTYEQVMAPLLEMQDKMKKAAKEFVQNLRDTANLLNGVFFQPLQDQFTKLFETGKFSFREFGRAIVENMKQVVAKLIATGIITLLATIATTALNPGAAAATGLTGFQMFSRAFAGQLGFGPQRGPNLANIGAGGLAMSGAVNLTLRGSDLVGALNRTNTNINRIG